MYGNISPIFHHWLPINRCTEACMKISHFSFRYHRARAVDCCFPGTIVYIGVKLTDYRFAWHLSLVTVAFADAATAAVAASDGASSEWKRTSEKTVCLTAAGGNRSFGVINHRQQSCQVGLIGAVRILPGLFRVFWWVLVCLGWTLVDAHVHTHTHTSARMLSFVSSRIPTARLFSYVAAATTAIHHPQTWVTSCQACVCACDPWNITNVHK